MKRILVTLVAVCILMISSSVYALDLSALNKETEREQPHFSIGANFFYDVFPGAIIRKGDSDIKKSPDFLQGYGFGIYSRHPLSKNYYFTLAVGQTSIGATGPWIRGSELEKASDKYGVQGVALGKIAMDFYSFKLGFGRRFVIDDSWEMWAQLAGGVAYLEGSFHGTFYGSFLDDNGTKIPESDFNYPAHDKFSRIIPGGELAFGGTWHASRRLDIDLGLFGNESGVGARTGLRFNLY